MKEIIIKVNDSYDVPDSIYALTCEEAQLWLTTIHEVLSTHDNVVNSAIQSEVSDLFSKKYTDTIKLLNKNIDDYNITVAQLQSALHEKDLCIAKQKETLTNKLTQESAEEKTRLINKYNTRIADLEKDNVSQRKFINDKHEKELLEKETQLSTQLDAYRALKDKSYEELYQTKINLREQHVKNMEDKDVQIKSQLATLVTQEREQYNKLLADNEKKLSIQLTQEREQHAKNIEDHERKLSTERERYNKIHDDNEKRFKEQMTYEREQHNKLLADNEKRLKELVSQEREQYNKLLADNEKKLTVQLVQERELYAKNTEEHERKLSTERELYAKNTEDHERKLSTEHELYNKLLADNEKKLATQLTQEREQSNKLFDIRENNLIAQITQEREQYNKLLADREKQLNAQIAQEREHYSKLIEDRERQLIQKATDEHKQLQNKFDDQLEQYKQNINIQLSKEHDQIKQSLIFENDKLKTSQLTLQENNAREIDRLKSEYILINEKSAKDIELAQNRSAKEVDFIKQNFEYIKTQIEKEHELSRNRFIQEHAQLRQDNEQLKQEYKKQIEFLNKQKDEISQSIEKEKTIIKKSYDEQMIKLEKSLEKSAQQEMHSLKSEIAAQKSTIEQLKVNLSEAKLQRKSLDDINTTLQPVIKFYGSKSSTEEKGTAGEKFIYNILTTSDRYTDSVTEDMSGVAKHGDLFFKWKQIRCMIEIKNKQTLTNTDIEKFERDIDSSIISKNINCAMFISLRTDLFPGKQRNLIQFDYRNNILVTYLSMSSMTDIHYSICCIDKLLASTTTNDERADKLIKYFIDYHTIMTRNRIIYEKQISNNNKEIAYYTKLLRETDNAIKSMTLDYSIFVKGVSINDSDTDEELPPVTSPVAQPVTSPVAPSVTLVKKPALVSTPITIDMLNKVIDDGLLLVNSNKTAFRIDQKFVAHALNRDISDISKIKNFDEIISIRRNKLLIAMVNMNSAKKLIVYKKQHGKNITRDIAVKSLKLVSDRELRQLSTLCSGSGREVFATYRNQCELLYNKYTNDKPKDATSNETDEDTDDVIDEVDETEDTDE